MIPKTAGTLNYVAPGERGKTATISLTASSKRGRAKLDLTASTGANSYFATGSTQGAKFAGQICSLDKPFTIDVTAITGNWPMEFTPSDGLSGQMTGTYSSHTAARYPAAGHTQSS